MRFKETRTAGEHIRKNGGHLDSGANRLVRSIMAKAEIRGKTSMAM
jgi:hypothetical protein